MTSPCKTTSKHSLQNILKANSGSPIDFFECEELPQIFHNAFSASESAHYLLNQIDWLQCHVAYTTVPHFHKLEMDTCRGCRRHQLVEAAPLPQQTGSQARFFCAQPS
jgi:hypothetical protein